MCLHDAAAIASAATVAPLPNPTAAAGIATLLGLKNALPDEGSPTTQQEKPSDVLAFRFDGEQQAGHVKQNAAVETMVIPAEDPTASGPMQPSETISSALTENETILQTDAELAVMVQQQEEAAK